jgi:hypothetical protein
MEHTSYDNYPARIVVLSNLLSAAIYAIGAFLLYKLGVVWMAAYLIYILWLEVKVLKRSCVNCCYYGKVCGFAKGKIAGILFKQGNPEKFTNRTVTFKDMLPDFMVSIIPVVLGVVLLIKDFNWLTLILIVILVLLSSAGNGFVRGSLVCKYCKQQELGCPAAELFKKK